jgi:hypothetical protein
VPNSTRIPIVVAQLLQYHGLWSSCHTHRYETKIQTNPLESSSCVFRKSRHREFAQCLGWKEVRLKRVIR